MGWTEAYYQRVREAAMKAVAESAYMLQGHIRTKLSTPSRSVSTGANGKRKIGARGSSRSKPGGAPHKDTGALRSSISVALDTEAIAATVGTNLKYGRWLEFGLPGGKTIRPKNGKVLSWVGPDGVRRFARSIKQGRLAPRPFMRPSYEEKKDEIAKHIADAGCDLYLYWPCSDTLSDAEFVSFLDRLDAAIPRAPLRLTVLNIKYNYAAVQEKNPDDWQEKHGRAQANFGVRRAQWAEWCANHYPVWMCNTPSHEVEIGGV